MMCDECGKRPANVHLTKIINGVKSESHLCEQCAREKGELDFFSEPKFSFPSLLAGLLQHDPGFMTGPTGLPGGVTSRCHSCGLDFSDFRNTGFLGCPDCYDELRPRLEPLLRRIHGSTRHTGRVPGRVGAVTGKRREIEKLRAELARLVAKEQYEEAAKVRDRIRILEKDLAGEG
ncbi:MAG: UvrB/UvrC motif-containing protein [Bacteroidota bacterium]